MNDEQKPDEIIDTRKGYLALPFNEEQFKDFIVGLLGKPQTITKKIEGDFEINLNDLQNFHEILNQRITQQNKGQLIQLKTKIYFSDDSTVLLGSYAELVSYREIKPVISTAIRMSWVYLIQFADKKVPEKQEIEILINSLPNENVEPEIYLLKKSPQGSGECTITIQHTARTWGNDMENLLINQVELIIQKENKIKTFVRRNSHIIGFMVGLLFFLGSLITLYFEWIKFTTNEVNRVNGVMKAAGNNISAKTDFIINYIASNTQNIYDTKATIYAIVSLIISALLGVWVLFLGNNKKYSYVILTSESIKNKEKCEKLQRHKWAWFILSMVTSILCGIVSNVIFGLVIVR